MPYDKNKCYEILGLKYGASQHEIKNAHNKLSKIYHPDNEQTGSTEKMQEINEAYITLFNQKLYNEEKRSKKTGTDGKDGKIEDELKAKEHYQKALKLEEEGDYTQAIKNIEKAIILDSKTIYKDKLQELQNKEEIQNQKEEEAKNEYQKAIKLEKEKKYTQAITHCQKAIKLNPKTIYKNKLKELQNQEKIQKQKKEEAKEHYQKGLKFENEGKYNLARKQYEKAVELDPKTIYKNKLKELQNQEKPETNRRRICPKCKKSIILDLETNYCPECGASLNYDPPKPTTTTKEDNNDSNPLICCCFGLILLWILGSIL